jgi:serine protease Do
VEVVVAGSPADKGGLLERDIVLSFDGLDVKDESHFRLLLARAEAGRPIAIEVRRRAAGGEARQISLSLTLSDMDLPPSSESSVEKPGLGAARTRMLGITVVPLTPDIARKLIIPDAGGGIAVVDVDTGSPADGKGIREGDVIVEMNSRPLHDLADLRAALDATPAGGVVMLRIVRNGEALGYRFLPR